MESKSSRFVPYVSHMCLQIILIPGQVRGLRCVQVNSGGLVAVNFPFLKYNVQTAEILKNFLEYHLQVNYKLDHIIQMMSSC